MDDRDPRMLPGRTAAALTSVMQAFLVVGITAFGIAFVALLPARVIPGFSHWSAAWDYLYAIFGLLGVFGVCLGIAVPIGAREGRTQKAELEAGYTTLLKEFDQVDGIDPKTGVVVRPAKVRAVDAPARDAITSGIELGTVGGFRTPVQVIGRNRIFMCFFAPTVAILVVCAVITAGSVNDDTLDALQVTALILGICALVAVFTLPITALATMPGRWNATHLAQMLPGTEAYVADFQSDDDLEELLGPDPAALPGARERALDYLVLAPAHFAFYSRQGADVVPYLMVPRSRISRATLTSIPQAQNAALPAAIFEITKDNGSTLQMTVALSAYSANTVKKLRTMTNSILDWANGRASHQVSEG